MKHYYKTNTCVLYQCDNLELMKSFPDDYVDLIYCDILYNTGRNFADFFMGSGTTGEAALMLKRKFIGCDIGDSACHLSQERLSKIG